LVLDQQHFPLLNILLLQAAVLAAEIMAAAVELEVTWQERCLFQQAFLIRQPLVQEEQEALEHQAMLLRHHFHL
jgi:hypothetical protein